MILGVAQVVVNVADLDGAMATMLAAGYTPAFSELDLANHSAKRSFQAVDRSTLDLVYLSPPAPGPAVELTAYDGPPPRGETVYTLAAPAPAGTIGGVVVRAARPAESLAFWTKGLGFAERGPMNGTAALEFPTPVPAWRLPVVLEGDAASGGPTAVDAEGCVLVTLLTTDLRRDLANLAESGLAAAATEVWEESIGGRGLQLAFVRGPSGELVELVQLAAPHETNRPWRQP